MSRQLFAKLVASPASMAASWLDFMFTLAFIEQGFFIYLSFSVVCDLFPFLFQQLPAGEKPMKMMGKAVVGLRRAALGEITNFKAAAVNTKVS